jgi:hypothetical protein
LDDKVVQRNLEDLACFIQRFNGVQYAFLKVFQKELFKERGFFWDIATPERLLVLAKDHKVSSGKFDAMFVKKGEALDSAIVASIKAFFMGDKPLKMPLEKFSGRLKLNSNSLDMGIERNEEDLIKILDKVLNYYTWQYNDRKEEQLMAKKVSKEEYILSELSKYSRECSWIRDQEDVATYRRKMTLEKFSGGLKLNSPSLALLSKMLGDHSNLYPEADQCLALLSKIKGHHSNLDSVMDQSISILEEILVSNEYNIRFLFHVAEEIKGLERDFAEVVIFRREAIQECNQASDAHARMEQSILMVNYLPSKERMWIQFP